MNIENFVEALKNKLKKHHFILEVLVAIDFPDVEVVKTKIFVDNLLKRCYNEILTDMEAISKLSDIDNYKRYVYSVHSIDAGYLTYGKKVFR